MSRRRSLLNDELYQNVVDNITPYDFVFFITDVGTLVQGGDDNNLCTITGTTLTISADKGVFAKVESFKEVHTSPGQGFGITENMNGSTLELLPDGSFTFDFGTAFRHLRRNRSISQTYPYTIIDDETGTELLGTITFRVYGTNKAPELVEALPDRLAKSLESVSWNIRPYFVDPNDGQTESLSFLLYSGLPKGLSLVGSHIVGTLDRLSHTTMNTETEGEWEIAVRAYDTDQAFVTGTFHLTLTRPTIIAADKEYTAVFDRVTSVTANEGLLSGIGSDGTVDGVGLVVTKINGIDIISAGTPVAITEGGTLYANPNGSFTFDPEGAYDTEPEDVSFAFTYTAENAAGATSTASVNVTVKVEIEYPTIIEPAIPSLVFTLLSGDPSIIGSTVTYRVIALYDKGSILLRGNVEPRAGMVSAFEFTGGSLAGIVPYVDDPTSFTAQHTVSTFTAVIDVLPQVFGVKAILSAGVQPVDSAGLPFGSPYPAGPTQESFFTVPGAGAYPWYATVGEDNTAAAELPEENISEAPADDDGKYLEIVLAERIGSGERIIKTPAVWGEITGLKVQDINNDWVWLYGLPAAFKVYYIQSVEVINGIDYNVYILMSGVDVAATRTRLYFN